RSRRHRGRADPPDRPGEVPTDRSLVRFAVLQNPRHRVVPDTELRVVGGSAREGGRDERLAAGSVVSPTLNPGKHAVTRQAVGSRAQWRGYTPAGPCLPMIQRLPQLGAEEIAHYRSEGWVVPGFTLPADEVASLRDALDDLIRANPGVRPE